VPTVYARENEHFEVLLKKFKKKCEKAAILSDIRSIRPTKSPAIKTKQGKRSRRKMLKQQRKWSVTANDHTYR
jgi:small subunit ribosomal protein S21